jgi:formylglycine-generating enzyme required for sulfatase activity
VDGHPRLANLATQLADETLAPPEEIQALGRVMLGVLPAIQSLSPGLRDLLKRMVQSGPQALTNWGQLLQGIKALEPKIVPTDAAKISAQDRAAIAAVELARKQQKKSLIYNLVSVISLLCLVAFTAWYFLRNKQRIYDEQIQIPAGEFIFATGEKKTLPDFWIDKYEVTIGQYADFVKALEDHPTTEFDHKSQPKSKNSAMHKPPHWDIYYGQAKDGGKAHSTPIDLSCPMIEVDYWDAYAYAKWKGRDLPTEEEWEKAARGTKGLQYPWGDSPDAKKVNSNADFNPNNPAAKGNVDGFNFWNPVDKMKGDKSPFGIVGMAGNVREWTGTWDAQKKRPVVKGGSFMSSDVTVSQRADLDPSAISEGVGFRTVSRTPPTK